MARFELDKWKLSDLYDYHKKGRLNLQPDYQRSKVWPDKMKYDLVDTVLHDWPMGLIMLNVRQHVDDDGARLERYEVVDGQQRLAALFGYKDGEHWDKKGAAKGSEFTPYAQLKPARQERFDIYKVSLALMREFEQDEILDIYSRLQNSKPLKMGEKVKALRSEFKPYIRELTEHKIFKVAGGAHRVRDSHWYLTSVFFKSLYRNRPLDRQEWQFLETFLRNEEFDQVRAEKARNDATWVLNYEHKVISEALDIDPSFEQQVASARVLKWLFASLMLLRSRFALAGKEHLVAKGALDYLHAKDVESTEEWVAYLNTGRTGRIDTDDVRACLEQLMNRVILTAELSPVDAQRFFNHNQRLQIFECCGGKCAKCGIELSKSNFHADHVVPHSQGGKTIVGNGQALCTACNRKKGGTPTLFDAPPV